MVKNNDILIFGEGYIGSKLKDYLGCNSVEKKIGVYQDIQEEIDKYEPKIIINAIGYTGYPNVDDCENNVDATLMANTFIPIMFAEAAYRHNIRLVHISSGCIYHFDYKSDAPITETDEPDFYNLFYSRTKIYAEKSLNLKNQKNTLILRIRIPLDNKPNPKNLIDKLVTYKKVIDIPNSVTYIPDLLKAIEHLITIKASGVYNIVNKGGLRYPKLLDIYKKYNPTFDYEVVALRDVLSTPRTNLIMSTKKLEKSGFTVRSIDDVLEECVKTYVKNKK